MKSIVTKAFMLSCAVMFTSYTATAQAGLGDLLNKLGGGSTSTNTQTESSVTDGLGAALGDILGGVLNLNTELTVADLEGTWAYSAPACKFQSEDFLKSAGGAVVASQISEKLAGYYQKLGFTSSRYSYVFDAEGKFTMNYGKIPLMGEVTKSDRERFFEFEFVKLGTYALATTPAYIEIQGNKMLLLYEVDKLIAMLRSLVGKLGVTTLDSIFKLLDGYDGVLIGFELEKK